MKRKKMAKMPSEQLLQIGILLVFVGIALIIFSALSSAGEKEKSKSTFKFSVVGFLGFIPFGFGNDRRLLLFGVVLTVVVVVATLILLSKIYSPRI